MLAIALTAVAAVYGLNPRLRTLAAGALVPPATPRLFAATEDPSPERVLMIEAADCFFRKDWRGAERIYRKLHAMNPDSPEIWYGLGLCRHHFGDYEGAIEANRHALADPNLAPLAQFALATEFAHLGRDTEALAALDRAFRIGFRDFDRVDREPAFCAIRHESRFHLPPAPRVHDFVTSSGEVIRYALVVPRDFDPRRTYPALLGLPGSRQNSEAVNFVLDNYWGLQAHYAGWIVVSPVAPERGGFAYGDDLKLVPELLDHVARTFNIEGGRFHLAGYSNGGTASLMLATTHPQRFHSVTTLPAYEISDSTYGRLDRLSGIPVTLAYGEEDNGPSESASRRIHERLRELGLDSTLKVYQGEPHSITGLMGERFMALMESIRATGRPGGATDHRRMQVWDGK